MGRKSLMTTELVETILNRVANGESIKEICRQKGMPDHSTVFRWMKDNEDLKEQFIFAMQTKAHLADAEIDEIRNALKGISGRVNSEEMSKDAAYVAIQEARLQIDTLKWKAAKYYPKVFGNDTKTVDVNVNGGSFLDDLKVVAARVEARKQVEALDAEYVVEGENLSTENASATHARLENDSQEDVGNETE